MQRRTQSGSIGGDGPTIESTTVDAAWEGNAIRLAIGTPGSQTDSFDLEEDKTANVSAIEGWTGKKYSFNEEGDDGRTFEAFVYSYVGKSKQGNKFGSPAASKPTGYEYRVDPDDEGFITLVGTDNTSDDDSATYTADSSRVAIPSVTRTSGRTDFELEKNRTYREISGSYHGVSGTYRCTPTSESACAVDSLGKDKGLSLVFADSSPAVWKFKPSNAETRTADEPDDAYSSFGWWIEEDEDGDTNGVSVFDSFRGTAVAENIVADTFNGLQGTATYKGGAVGQYALRSSTGGLNESGHFTAQTTLNADFDAVDTNEGGMISGSVHDFKVGDAGSDRDWTVKLNQTAFADVTDGTHVSTVASNDDSTVWTIGSGDDAISADESGSWMANLRNDKAGGDGGVPEVATGAFYSEFGDEGRMVGAFGANYEKGQ